MACSSSGTLVNTPRLSRSVVRSGKNRSTLFSQDADVGVAVRPIFHPRRARIAAPIVIAFLAYCRHVTLGRRLHALAPRLKARSVPEKFSAVQLIDVHLPTADGRALQLTRYTPPEPESPLQLEPLRLDLPAQPPPKITAAPAISPAPV